MLTELWMSKIQPASLIFWYLKNPFLYLSNLLMAQYHTKGPFINPKIVFQDISDPSAPSSLVILNVFLPYPTSRPGFTSHDSCMEICDTMAMLRPKITINQVSRVSPPPLWFYVMLWQPTSPSHMIYEWSLTTTVPQKLQSFEQIAIWWNSQNSRSLQKFQSFYVRVVFFHTQKSGVFPFPVISARTAL